MIINNQFNNFGVFEKALPLLKALVEFWINKQIKAPQKQTLQFINIVTTGFIFKNGKLEVSI